MEKSLYSGDHTVLVALLRDLRHDAGLTQAEVAERVGRHQSFVSKYESGQRRLDLVELDAIATALDTDLLELVRAYLERRVS